MPSLAIFLAGLVVGSFLNVCIYRLPRGISIVFPGSRCPHCGRKIRPWENVPVLSFLLLRGRCAGCGMPISWRYPAVELLTALLFLALYHRFGWSPALPVNMILVSSLIVLTIVDLTHRILPDVVTLGGTVVGILVSPWQAAEFFALPGSWSPGGEMVNHVTQSLLGVLFGAGFLWLVARLYRAIRGVEGMGMGDIKMMAMVGAFLGWQLCWLTILLGSFLGALVGGLYIWLSGQGRRYELPFGTFLGIAALACVFLGPQLVSSYVAFLQN
ncbi:MAG: A24 family peptidase [Acidobacteriota bacterium]